LGGLLEVSYECRNPAKAGEGKDQSMSDSIVEFEIEEVNFEASDEALEIAAAAGQANAYTLGACTGLSVCPA
jgi:hypothetical protein